STYFVARMSVAVSGAALSAKHCFAKPIPHVAALMRATHPTKLVVAMAVLARLRLLVGCGRDHHHAAVAHAAFGNDVVGKVPDLAAPSLQRRDLHAGIVVEMDVQRRQRQIVMTG